MVKHEIRLALLLSKPDLLQINVLFQVPSQGCSNVLFQVPILRLTFVITPALDYKQGITDKCIQIYEL